MKGFDYIQIFYYKWISSYGKTISEYNVKTPNLGCFFIWSIECVEKTDFVQLIISLSNESENPLWCNYTDKGQSWISLAYFHLNSFLVIILFIHEVRLGVC